MRLADTHSRASHAEPAHARSARLPHDTRRAAVVHRVGAAVQRRRRARKTGDRRDRAAAETVTGAKQGAKVGGNTAGGSGKGGEAFADVAVGRAGAEARCSRV